MAQDPTSDNQPTQSTGSISNPLTPAQDQATSAQAKNDTGHSQGSGKDDEKKKDEPRKLLPKLEFSAWANVFVGVASLVVSYFTYRNAADTSDLQHAVTNLSNLAKDTHRQADTAHDAYVGSNRGWLHVSVDPKGLAITWEDNGGVVVTGQMITNNEGNSPALGVLTNYKAFIEGKESTFSQYIVNFCSTGKHNEPVFKEDNITDDMNLTISSGDFASLVGPNVHGPTGMLHSLDRRGYLRHIQMYLGVCTSYRVVGDSSRHYTGKLYRLAQSIGQNPAHLDSPQIGQNQIAGTVYYIDADGADYAD